MAAAQLADEVKTFIVQSLACFDAPSVVVKSVKAEFNLVVSPQQVEAYDPTKRAGRRLSKGWREIFAATRKTFLEDTADIAVSHRAVRLRALGRMIAKAEDMRNLALAGQLLEQAAKECGNAYTNRRELSGPEGKPIQTEAMTPDLSRTSQSDRDALRAILERAAGKPGGSSSGD
ncbi:DUF2280 domain-containing protein [Beijerinckia sp. L45]|uniref:DUF2280 domain-containing protein n=1 Tax=Beijerinckia sp. L45 TaxID=1641855 RepID=UPI00131AB6F6|nr:DUF2280 domain-containing protein [Beijerinckia sp. L45]